MSLIANLGRPAVYAWAAIHLLAIILLSSTCFDTFYAASCPQGTVTQLLASPWLLVMRLTNSTVYWLNAITFIVNSILWGLVIVKIYDILKN